MQTNDGDSPSAQMSKEIQTSEGTALSADEYIVLKRARAGV